MLDVAILDNVERLLLRTPPQSLIPSVTGCAPNTGLLAGFVAKVLAMPTIGAGTLGELITGGLDGSANLQRYFISQDYSKVWITGAGLISGNKKTALFDVATETLSLDDTVGRDFVKLTTDNTGAAWAVSGHSSYYGLWKRTGAATWTQVASDSGIGVGLRWRASDNTLWYQSYTNNHYLLSNGAATLQTAPSGTLQALPSYGPCLAFEGAHVDSTQILTAGSYVAALLAADGTALTPQPSVPYEMLFNASFSNCLVRQIRVDATYSLFVQSVSDTSAIYHLFLYNRTSNVIQYIGSLPTLNVRTSAVWLFVPFAATLGANGISIYFHGGINCTTGPAISQAGVLRIDTGYQPNF